MRVVELRRELDLVQRTESLFNRFPDSKHPTKMHRLDIKAETAPDPEFDAALAEDPELAEFLSKSMFLLPGRMELLRGSIGESAPSVDVTLITCKGCGSGVLLLDEQFYNAHR